MGRGSPRLGVAPLLLQLTHLSCHSGCIINLLVLSSFSLTSVTRRAAPPGLPRQCAFPSHLLQATEEPVVPVEPLESMLRPFNLVIPFTVQKGELTGKGSCPHGALVRTESTCWPFV